MLLLLLGLIWSFHIQYAQPPSFYLKAPTVMYIFIFITVRALRFDATYVLAAGVAAAAGWLGMLAYAVTHDPAPEPITRDYIAYMTGNRILLGAEIDKIITILVVTGILAVVLVRARTTPGRGRHREHCGERPEAILCTRGGPRDHRCGDGGRRRSRRDA